MVSALRPLVPLFVSFDHYGLANAAVLLGILTLISGLGLIGTRQGWVGDDRLYVVLRIGHIVFGVFMTLYVFGAYLFTPV